MDRLDRTSERGAVLVFTALAMLALVGFLVFVIDQGVLLVARGQAQNAADAGALAGAVARAYDDVDGTTLKAAQAAEQAAEANTIWDGPGVARVSWGCPPAFSGSCVRVDVHRDGSFDSTALPTVFGSVLNVTTQRVRATATAHVSAGNAVECLRPFAIVGNLPDFTVANVGDVVTLRFPEIRLIDTDAPILGPIRSCVITSAGLSDTLPRLVPDPGNEAQIKADILLGVQQVIDLDPGASYLGGTVASPCVAAASCQQYLPEHGPGAVPVPDPGRTFSPRIVPIALSEPGTAGHEVHLANVLGFFITGVVDDPPNGPEITGTLVPQPGLLVSSYPTVSQEFGFLQVIRLVR